MTSPANRPAVSAAVDEPAHTFTLPNASLDRSVVTGETVLKQLAR
jgi:hypothetical protein